MGKTLAISLLLLVGLSACAPAMTLERRFYETAILDELSGKEHEVFRRNNDLRIAIQGGSAEDHAKILAISAQIAEATGLSVLAVSTWDSPNVQVLFVSDETWLQMVEYDRTERTKAGLSNHRYDPKCAVNYFTDEDQEPLTTVIIPDSHRGLQRSRCLAQELAHTTGLLFDTDSKTDTVFSGLNGTDYLTPVDYQLLKILYDSRLRSGMSWREAKPIVRQIVRELETAP